MQGGGVTIKTVKAGNTGSNARSFVSKEETLRRERAKEKQAQKMAEQAQTKLEQKKYSEALDLLTYALNLFPSAQYVQGNLYFQRAECLRMMGSARCVDDYRTALDGNPGNPTYLEARSKWHLQQNDYSQAVYDLGKAISGSAEGSMHRFYLQRALVYITWKKPESALNDLDKAVSTGGGVTCYIERANLLVAMGRAEKAIPDFETALALSPNNHEAYFCLGMAYLKLDERGEALAQFTNAIRGDSQDPEYYAARGRAFILLDQFLPAISDFELAISLSSTKRPEYHVFRSIAQRGARRFDKALEDLDEAINLQPHREAFHFARGLVLQDMHRHEEALATFAHTFEIGGNLHHAAVHRMAMSHRALGKLTESIACFTKLIDDPDRKVSSYKIKDPVPLSKVDHSIIDIIAPGRGLSSLGTAPDPLWLEGRGLALMEASDYRNALVDLGALTSAVSEHPMGLFHSGKAYQKLKCYNDAIEKYEAATRLGETEVERPKEETREERPKTAGPSRKSEREDIDINPQNVKPEQRLPPQMLAQIYHKRARCHEHIGQPEIAIEHLTTAMKLDPTSAKYPFHRGRCFCSLGRYTDAVADLSAALQIEPDSSRILYHKGVCIYRLEDYPQAIENLKEALSKDLEQSCVPECHSCIGICYSNLNNHASAIASFSKAIEANSNHADSIHERAKAHQALQAHTQAIEDFTLFLKYYPNNSHAYFRRGFSYKALQQWEQAASDFHLAKVVDPSNPFVVLNYHKLQNIPFIELCRPGQEPGSFANYV